MLNGMFDGLQIAEEMVEEQKRFYIIRVIVALDHVPRKFWVRNREGHRVCFIERELAEWFCETAADKGLEQAMEEAVARFEIITQPRPDDTRMFPS